MEKGPGAQALTDAEPLILGEANTLFPPQNRVNNVVVILWGKKMYPLPGEILFPIVLALNSNKPDRSHVRGHFLSVFRSCSWGMFGEIVLVAVSYGNP